MMEVVVTTGLLELQVVQSSSQIITNNKPTCSVIMFRMFDTDSYNLYSSVIIRRLLRHYWGCLI